VTFSLVLPGYVDTALLAGARPPLFPPISRPEAVARAVVAVLQTGASQRYVPRYLGLFALVPLLLPPWLLHRVGRWTGVSRSLAAVEPQGSHAKAALGSTGDRASEPAPSRAER